MLIKFLCWLFGHKVMAKAYTGETMETWNTRKGITTSSMYVWERQDYCIRCGKKNEE